MPQLGGFGPVVQAKDGRGADRTPQASTTPPALIARVYLIKYNHTDRDTHGRVRVPGKIPESDQATARVAYRVDRLALHSKKEGAENALPLA